MRQHISSLFSAAGLSRFGLASEVDALIAHAQRTWRRRLSVAIIVSFVAGFGLCMFWYGTQITVLQTIVSAWKVQYDVEHASHHAKETKPVSKAAAQVISQRLLDARGGKLE